MRPGTFRATLYAIAALSIACFVIGAFQRDMRDTFAWAAAGAILPVLGTLALSAYRRARWKAMGKALGLRPYDRAAFPDLVGLRQGDRLLVGRRKDPFTKGIHEITVVRWGKRPELKAPGLLTDAEQVAAMLAPFED